MTARDREFDWRRSECVLPARTNVLAYICPQTRDLWVHTSDGALCCDAEFRINAEDINDFISGLIEIVNRGPVQPVDREDEDAGENSPSETHEPHEHETIGNGAGANAPPRDPTAAERMRRYRANKRRNAVTDEGSTVTQDGKATA